MKIKIPKCPKCGEEVRGTVDTIPGLALVSVQADGTYEYDGETDVFWDGQMTDKSPNGRWWLECPQGHQWLSAVED